MKKQHGFTIIELLMAISLLAIVVTVFSSAYIRTYHESKNNSDKLELIEIRNNLSSYIEFISFDEVKEMLSKNHILYVTHENNSILFENQFSTENNNNNKYYITFSGNISYEIIIKLLCKIYTHTDTNPVDQFMLIKSQ